ncbi:uncharacterized protein LOC132066239 [Lycium ferocissimum]|uniref:uncharacterized protein LOC132066239 n=1 Tax=Lycium ferocissimum TaxID=112874 RepID=UPI002814A62A|nr:uncharacterized protein LOC132066239 [Lycium ferocissimum]
MRTTTTKDAPKVKGGISHIVSFIFHFTTIIFFLIFARHHSPPMSASTENRSLRLEILQSTGHIKGANSGHFRVLSILFGLPIFFTLVTYPYFRLAVFHPDYDFTIFTQPQLSHFFVSNFEIFLLLMFTFFVFLFFLCAVATITYSTVHASYGRRINLVSSIKSIRSSFFPLLSTFIVSQTIFISITLLFALVLVLLSQTLQTLGLLELKYDLNHFLFFGIFALIVLVPVLIWLQVNWSLAYVVAVVESKWGIETLRRSAHLVKGMRSVALSVMLFYGLVVVGTVGGSYLVTMGTAKGEQWTFLSLQMLESSVVGYVVMNQYLMGNAVLYMYCKDLNDEKLPFEIEDEFGNEYVSLNMV